VGSSKIKKLLGLFINLHSFTLACSPPLKTDILDSIWFFVKPTLANAPLTDL
jgi:hypothetical protein